MKKFIIILIMACTLSGHAQNTKVTVLKQFLSDIINFNGEVLNEQQPIISIGKMSKDHASEIIEITRESMKAALIEAKSFNHCLIIVNYHTIIRITDNEDCSPSGSWQTCMPLSKAYIQKAGMLYEKKGYMKNLIGRPDSQKRTMYLFK